MKQLLISGIEYVPGYLDQQTHDRLLSAVDQRPWQISVDHRVQVYGYHYDHKKRAAYRIGELPEWATPLARRLHQDGFVPSIPNQLVANDYQPGGGISDHIDRAAFGNVVVLVSLGSTCVMRFTQSDADGSREVLLEPRSVLVLSGEARWRWKHSIPSRLSDRWDGQEYVRSRRVSLSFRVIPDETYGVPSGAGIDVTIN